MKNPVCGQRSYRGVKPAAGAMGLYSLRYALLIAARPTSVSVLPGYRACCASSNERIWRIDVAATEGNMVSALASGTRPPIFPFRLGNRLPPLFIAKAIPMSMASGQDVPTMPSA